MGNVAKKARSVVVGVKPTGVKSDRGVPVQLMPKIRARLIERFIFNFRLPIELLGRQLPSWLAPQSIEGASVGSFCVLDLDQVTFGPVPDELGLRNINCALRFGVIERETGTPAVYVTERNTNSRLGAFITSLGFPGEHRLVEASITSDASGSQIRVRDKEHALFSATVARESVLRSSVFRSLDEFSAFMAGGVRSYCPAKNPGCFNVVDLHKSDSTYEPLRVTDLTHDLFSESSGSSDAVQDSAVRTEHGRYVWEYVGQRNARK
ncbi:MAG: hypothetical protein ACKVS9_13370 [Phycisphaerae bacterium]